MPPIHNSTAPTPESAGAPTAVASPPLDRDDDDDENDRLSNHRRRVPLHRRDSGDRTTTTTTTGGEESDQTAETTAPSPSLSHLDGPVVVHRRLHPGTSPSLPSSPSRGGLASSEV